MSSAVGFVQGHTCCPARVARCFRGRTCPYRKQVHGCWFRHDDEEDVEEVPLCRDVAASACSSGLVFAQIKYLVSRIQGLLDQIVDVASAIHRDTRAVSNLFEQLAGRVGAIPVGGELPRALRQQRWSPVNVPLIWAAAGDDDTNPVLEWLGARALTIQEAVPFHGGQTEPSQALRLGWVALREVFRNWGVRTREDLTNWLGTHGHPRSSPGSYLAARTQELILSAACGSDARVALLEAVFVAIVVDMGRAIAVPSCPHPVSRVPMTTRRGQVRVPTEITADSWGQMDQVDLDEMFLMRVPMLKNCPHFLGDA